MQLPSSKRYLFADHDGRPLCDKASPVAEILFRFDAYWKLARHALAAGVPVLDLVQARNVYRQQRGSSQTPVLENLRTLREAWDRRGAPSILTVRLMFRPSQAGSLQAEQAFWLRWADAVLPAPLFAKSHDEDHVDYGSDIYTLTAKLHEYPRCYFPFNELDVLWTPGRARSSTASTPAARWAGAS